MSDYLLLTIEYMEAEHLFIGSGLGYFSIGAFCILAELELANNAIFAETLKD